jgi:DNA-directed RNA polymerase subunit RPC12/RpoP
MKYKPTLFAITKEVAKLNNPTATAISGILETALHIGTRYYTGNRIYSCGNPRCNKAFEPFISNAERPLVCPQCGEEIDWEGIATRKIKVCPQCRREYDLYINYCPYHIPKVALKEEEIPL